jgi:hypothetical protein
VNNGLVWSGVIAEKAVIVEQNSVSPRLIMNAAGARRGPSNSIPLTNTLNESKRATVKTTLPIQTHQKSPVESSLDQRFPTNTSKLDVSLTFTGLASTTDSSVGMSTTDFLRMEGLPAKCLKESSSIQSSSEPTWFSDLKTPREAPVVNRDGNRDRVVQPPSREMANDIFSDDILGVKSSANEVKSRPNSRRRAGSSSKNPGDDVSVPSAKAQVETSSIAQSAPTIAKSDVTDNNYIRKPGRREVQKANETLFRQSLEAINKSDRANRGRLQQEIFTAASADVNNGTVPEEPSEQMRVLNKQTSGEISNIGIPLEATVAVNISQMRMKAVESVGEGTLGSELSLVKQQRQALRQRSERIDQVQEKVSSALANLAGVMSSLSGGASRNSDHTTKLLTGGANIVATKSHLSKLQSEKPFSNEPQLIESRGTDNSEPQNMPRTDEPIAPQPSEGTMSGALDLAEANFGVSVSADPTDSFLENSICEIPVMPKGRLLEIEILSTWGDPYYIGLNGIDLFDAEGLPLLVDSGISRVSANPSDINILPEYFDDPRTIANILDGVNFTRDDLHVWLAPHGFTLTPKLPYVAKITINFTKFTTISLLRIWNYNKSRTHCYRGAKRCRILLDTRVIFEGDIKAAPGLLTSAADCSEVILFTSDRTVLAKISQVDSTIGEQKQGLSEEELSAKLISTLKERKADNRPRTADKGPSSSTGRMEENVLLRRKQSSKPEVPFEKVVQTSEIRPMTAAIRIDPTSTTPSKPPIMPPQTRAHLPTSSAELRKSIPSSASDVIPESQLIECRVISLVLERTWGDKCYIGLGGVEVLIGGSCIVADIDPTLVDANPRDLSAIGCFDDPRTPDKLVDGVNNTTDDTHMWLIPFTKGSSHTLTIDMGARCRIAGLNIWNYNKSPEDSLRGARLVALYADSQLIGKAELRIAPGCDGVEYKQTLLIKDIRQFTANAVNTASVRYIAPVVKQDYETPCLPSGTMWRFKLFSNWGDGYYIGLDGLQFLDEKGISVSLASGCTITANPYSLQDIEVQDSRVPSNIAKEPYHDPSGTMAWLAPLSQCVTDEERCSSIKRVSPKHHSKKPSSTPGYDHDPLFFDDNTLFVMFDRPMSISGLR